MKKSQPKTLILSLLAIIILSISCQTLDPVALTKFSSKPPFASDISHNSATVSAKFMDVGDGITLFGHCWAISTLPSVENFKKDNSGVPEKQTEFTSKLENLLPETQYFVRAYAATGGNIIYSQQMDFKTLKMKSIKISKPKIGDKWNISSTQLIEWTDDIDENVKISLFKNNTKLIDITATTESDGLFEWIVPASAELSTDYAIKIESINDVSIADTSDLFEIKDDPYITILKPNTTDTWICTSQYEIKWTDNIAENVNIELYKAGAKNSDIALNVASNQSYLWTIPHSLSAGSDYNIKITSTVNSSIAAQSDQFKIAEEPYISITAPAANAKWIKGQQFQIVWTDNITENVNIELYKVGVKISDIQLNTPSNGNYTWTVPNTLTAATDYTIKITSTTNSTLTAQSSQFTIADAPFITITAPAAGTEWTDGKEYEIKWTDNMTENVDIELFKGGVKNSNIALNTPSDQSHLWTIPTALIAASDYTIKITSTSNSSIVGVSGQFKIIEDPYIKISSPVAGANWIKGQDFEVKWTDNILENVNIELYKRGIKNRDIILNTPSDQSHLWTVSASLVAGNDYSLKITSTTNSLLTAESGQFSITESVIDIDGNVYGIVAIGSQVWMSENLKTTKYQNGDLIGTTVPATLDISSESTPKYQWAYDGNSGNAVTYGRLYTWYAVSESRNICPIGWHIPNEVEWNTLTDYLGGLSIAGGKLKEIGLSHWMQPNEGATNESGFTAFGSGYRFATGSFTDMTVYAGWWSLEEKSSTNAWSRAVYRHVESVGINSNGTIKSYGESVRCIKD